MNNITRRETWAEHVVKEAVGRLTLDIKIWTAGEMHGEKCAAFSAIIILIITHRSPSALLWELRPELRPLLLPLNPNKKSSILSMQHSRCQHKRERQQQSCIPARTLKREHPNSVLEQIQRGMGGGQSCNWPASDAASEP